MTGVSASIDGQKKDVEVTTVALIRMRAVTKDEVAAHVMRIAPIYGPDLTEQDLAAVIAAVETQVFVLITPGDVLFDPKTNIKWLTQARKSSINWNRWSAYQKYLTTKGLPPRVIDTMRERADTILELAGDPIAEGSWSRRGLVIGDVQSGKTANYLALFNKAADAGYRIIILFGGHTDKLRRQTQVRVDEGFVGVDSRRSRPGSQFQNAAVGVGQTPGFIPAAGFTTYQTDFSVTQLYGTNLTAQAISSPVIFVIKKNKRIIENLITWLKAQIGPNDGGKLSQPLLLLDDEADYASINTNDPEQDPTAINAGIQDLLGVFRHNTYVGFTATPFANVLINDELEEDLFPRDFIFTLDSPSNYFGPEEMFEEKEGQAPFIVNNSDADLVFPFSHKSSQAVGTLPDSLKDAVCAFFLVNALRDLRGQQSQPRTMMVNVSRFVKVQARVYELIQDEVAELKDAVSQRREGPSWARLKKVWDEQYASGTETWLEIRRQLDVAAEDIVVRVVNSKNNTDDWDAVYDSDRARVIAVGGDVLSRGLTLEGLTISYFYRKSVAYDTLMQMGRWFGYRDGYKDVCRLWMEPDVATWYAFIAHAIQELRGEIRQMRMANATPKEFGLAVLMHPGALLTVTARNKSKHSSRATKVSLRNQSVETPRLQNDFSVNQSNARLVRELIDKIRAKGIPQLQSHSNYPWWSDVPAELVAEFIEAFQPAKAEVLFTHKIISKHLSTTKAPWMRTWDVVVVGGRGRPDAFFGDSFQRVQRAVYHKDGVLFCGGNKMRLGGRGDVGQVLSRSERERIHKTVGDQVEPNDKDYRLAIERPLLLIYPIEAELPKNGPNEKQTRAGFDLFTPLDKQADLIGIHVAFPKGDGYSASESETVNFLANKIYAAQNSLIELADDAYDDDEEVG